MPRMFLPPRMSWCHWLMSSREYVAVINSSSFRAPSMESTSGRGMSNLELEFPKIEPARSADGRGCGLPVLEDLLAVAQ
jgi:hypothetical protein